MRCSCDIDPIFDTACDIHETDQSFSTSLLRNDFPCYGTYAGGGMNDISSMMVASNASDSRLFIRIGISRSLPQLVL